MDQESFLILRFFILLKHGVAFVTAKAASENGVVLFDQIYLACTDKQSLSEISRILPGFFPKSY